MTWIDGKLGDYLKVEHGFAFKGEHFSDSGEFVVLTPGNFHEAGGFRSRPAKDRFYAAAFPERHLLQRGDLIVAMTEQGEGLLGSSALIPEGNRYLHNQRLGLVKERKERAERRFLYYLFNSSSVREQIRNTSSGAKVRHTSPERIYSVSVRIPDLATQSKIAAILSAYDDLIANHQRRIALLESMAEEVYREWFVRWRYSGYTQQRARGGMPDGWRPGLLNEIAIEASQPSQSGKHLETRFYVPLDALGSGRMLPNDHYSWDQAQSSLVTFEKDDFLFGAMRPYQHKVAIAPFAGISRSTAFVIRPKRPELYSYLFLTLFQRSSVLCDDDL